MAKESAGILVYRKQNAKVDVLLAHPGGPFFTKKDEGVWSIPKGEAEEREDLLEAAKREFQEELGLPVPIGELAELNSIRQAGGKTVHAWAVEGDIDVSRVVSNTFEMEWPPHSGNKQSFPENDKTEWFSLSEAAKKINPGQVEFLRQLAQILAIEFTLSDSNEKSSQQSLF
jgi:predicted NUDIX family NTP pyrophosphohydrolase